MEVHAAGIRLALESVTTRCADLRCRTTVYACRRRAPRDAWPGWLRTRRARSRRWCRSPRRAGWRHSRMWSATSPPPSQSHRLPRARRCGQQLTAWVAFAESAASRWFVPSGGRPATDPCGGHPVMRRCVASPRRGSRTRITARRGGAGLSPCPPGSRGVFYTVNWCQVGRRWRSRRARRRTRPPRGPSRAWSARGGRGAARSPRPPRRSVPPFSRERMQVAELRMVGPDPFGQRPVADRDRPRPASAAAARLVQPVTPRS